MLTTRLDSVRPVLHSALCFSSQKRQHRIREGMPISPRSPRVSRRIGSPVSPTHRYDRSAKLSLPVSSPVSYLHPTTCKVLAIVASRTFGFSLGTDNPGPLIPCENGLPLLLQDRASPPWSSRRVPPKLMPPRSWTTMLLQRIGHITHACRQSLSLGTWL
jgi:hypothetical protein